MYKAALVNILLTRVYVYFYKQDTLLKSGEIDLIFCENKFCKPLSIKSGLNNNACLNVCKQTDGSVFR